MSILFSLSLSLSLSHTHTHTHTLFSQQKFLSWRTTLSLSHDKNFRREEGCAPFPFSFLFLLLLLQFLFLPKFSLPHPPSRSLFFMLV